LTAHAIQHGRISVSLLLVGLAAINSSYGYGLAICLPPLILLIASRWRRLTTSFSKWNGDHLASGKGRGVPPIMGRRELWCSGLLVAIFVGSPWYCRNALASGDPFFPWGRVFSGYSEQGGDTPLDVQAWWAGHRPQHASSDAPEQTEGLMDCVHRLMWNSTAHGLVLIPLALLGWIAGRDDLQVRLTGYWFAVWVASWWLASPRMDRDWVVAIPLLAWPASAAIAWFHQRSGNWFLMPVTMVCIAWSTVTLSAWPLSDNRLLVSLPELQSSFSGAGQGGADAEHVQSRSTRDESKQGRGVETNFRDWLNRHWSQLCTETDENGKKSKRLLLVGTSDAFCLNMPTLTNGLYNRSLMDLLAEQADPQARSTLRANQIALIVIDWRSLAIRDEHTGRDQSAIMRRTIARLVESGTITSIDWDWLSSEAELFRVAL
jgi:hypothetical protein